MNYAIFLKFYSLSYQSAYLDKLIFFVADTLPYIVVVGAVVFLLFHHEVFKSVNPFLTLIKKWKEILIAFFSGVIAWSVATIIKIIMQVPRPYLTLPDIKPLISKTDFSFPSGHATFFMALGIAIYLSHKKAGCVFIILAILIGLARIIVGVHFPSDILAGFCLGIIIPIFIDFLYKRYLKV